MNSLLDINGTSIEEGYDHQQVVNLLRSSSSSSTSIVLEVERNEPAEYYSSKTQGSNGLKTKKKRKRQS
uniref:PDZ domain-containing protein n=1 Tax=Ditylenchus dipsaci TaxID=166011 RepID=A0A915EI35_9BILA